MCPLWSTSVFLRGRICRAGVPFINVRNNRCNVNAVAPVVLVGFNCWRCPSNAVASPRGKELKHPANAVFQRREHVVHDHDGCLRRSARTLGLTKQHVARPLDRHLHWGFRRSPEKACLKRCINDSQG